MNKKPKNDVCKKDMHNKEASNNTSKFCKSVCNTIESELHHIDLFQIFKGNREIEDNLLEKVNDKFVVDDL